jgi:hypothetical protein
MVYSGKVKRSKKGKIYIKVNFQTGESKKYNIIPEVLKEMGDMFNILPDVEHDLLCSIEQDLKGNAVAIPVSIKISKEAAKDNPALLTLLTEGADEIIDEAQGINHGMSFEEFSQQNWTNFIEALKKEFGPRLPGYGAFETFARKYYTGPGDKSQMS